VADNLTPSESAMLIILMVEAGPIANPELKRRSNVSLDGASRRKLNDLGYVKTKKVGRGFVHELDDKGWDRVHQELNFEGPSGRTINAALGALHKSLREQVLTKDAYQRFGEMFTGAIVAGPIVEGPAGQDLTTRIRRLYESLASEPGAWIKHTAVRLKLGDVPDADLDAAFLALSEADDVDMMPESNQKTLTDEDRRSAVRVGGQDTHLLAIGTR
jgi:hypothetical protein